MPLDDWDAVRLIADPVDEAAQRELRWVVTDALRCLPAASRTVLVLFYYDGLTVREIAAKLGVTTAAVKSRLHNGRGQLGRLLPPNTQNWPAPPGARKGPKP